MTTTPTITTNKLYGIKDESFIDFLTEQGYIAPKQLQDGEWVAIYPLAFSTSVCSGIDVVTAFKYRWCFARKEDAQAFFDSMVDFDDIPDNLEALVGHRYTNGTPLVVMKDRYGNNRW